MLRDLPLEEKPREKAKLYGFDSLTDAELLAILLRTGTKEKNVKDLAIEILKEMEDVKGLQNGKLSKLANIKGVGEVKAITILAALELGKRYHQTKQMDRLKIRETKDVYEAYRHLLEGETQEKLLALFLNVRNEVLAHKMMFVGAATQSIVEPKEIFKEAMLYNANKIIILHNHPSGNPSPSKEDFSLTDQIRQIGQFLHIPLMDHLIIGDQRYFSFYSYLKRSEGSEA